MKIISIHVILAVLFVILASNNAMAQTISDGWLPGSARVISRSRSASRDTPVFEYAVAPRAQGQVGAEFGLYRKKTPYLVFSSGIYGMTAFANATEDDVILPHEVWRGLLGLSTSFALPELSKKLFGPGSAFEFTLLFGHESNYGVDIAERYNYYDLPQSAGDFIAFDVALQTTPTPNVQVGARLQNRFFVLGYLSHSPSADLWFRWRLFDQLIPTWSVNAEQLIPKDTFVRNGYVVRSLLGIALPGRFGELLPFFVTEIGNDRGLIVHRRELRLGAGVRYALF